MPDKERQHWPIAQPDGPPTPFGRNDATKAFLGADGGIDSQVRITPRKEVLALPFPYAMGTKSPGLKTDNDISRTHFIRSPSFDRKQVADPQSGKHTVATNYGARLPECLKDLQKKLVPRFLNKIGAHCQSHCIPVGPQLKSMVFETARRDPTSG